jgi:beta-mannosidase
MHCLSLNGAWRVAQSGHSATIPARVPGCIHTDLLAAGRIPDPFHRDQETAVQWVGATGWVYSRDFQVPAAVLRRERVLLRCNGLDTLATVRVNGREVGRADNMYRTWEFDVKRALKAGRNHIEVTFDSVLPEIAKRQQERHMPSWGGPKEIQGRSWIRKEPCNFGWDWGPTLVTCGIWRTMSILAFDTARLTGVQIRQTHADDRVVLRVHPEIERSGKPVVRARVRIRREGMLVAEAAGEVGRPAAIPLELTVENPALWWPNGLGEQPLYTVDVELLDARGIVLDAITRRVGLRTLRLDRHPDQWGESFQFVVNGVPFFAKGGNWIPADAFATRVSWDDYARLLNDVADVNMNMLRVWGGGLYESDAFYDLCDELGICVWQDFMFACSAYPTFDKAFMASVKAEAEDNVRRIRHHACVALWCGNNELEQGLVGDTWNDRQMSWEDYGRLFDTLLPGIIGALDPDRDYWPCSPHSPHGDRKDHSNPKWGDAHLWEVWHGRKPFEWYRTCEHRFNSEFGFQSFPEPKTVLGYTAPQDRNVTTYVMEHHQRSGIGNTAIMQYMLDWFRLPDAFDHTLWLSQILQGMAMKYAVEHWRRAMPRGMGTLYWQINDCWPVASWASIDYHGRWKALHYMARKFYAPVAISALEDAAAGTVEVHVTNDLRDAVTGKVTWVATDVAGRVLAKGAKAVEAKALGNTRAVTADLAAVLAKQGPRDVIVWVDLWVGGERRSSNLALFARPKHLELADPKIGLSVKDLKDGSFVVTLTARKPALWTWLEMDQADAQFSDNFMHLLPGQPQSVIVTPARAMTLARMKKALRVRSLFDTYA